MPIRDIASLRRHLQWTIELEHSTIPPYLSALYSLYEGTNEDARRVLLSIALEEMLHMTLAANVLNAVGGKPRLDHPGFLPKYPSYLPHSNQAFLVHVAPFTRDTVEGFLKIERPASHDALPEDDNYETIGQFYEAIDDALEHLCAVHGEAHVFTGDPARQLGPEAFHYDGAGNIVVVTDLASAKEAMEEIVEQGEGLDHGSIWSGDRSMFHRDRHEVSHYFRLQEMLAGRHFKHGDTAESGPSGRPCAVDWDAVYPMRPNPKPDDFPEGSAARVALHAFDRAYCDLLRRMHRAFNGEPEQMALAVGEMYQIKALAQDLVRMPTGDGVTTVGMSYLWVPPAQFEDLPDTARLEGVQPARVRVLPHGPYMVEGEVPLKVRTRVMSELGEALTWKTGPTLRERGPYALCRCGRSDKKPFCDGSHARTVNHQRPFDGDEDADTRPRAERAKTYPPHRKHGLHLAVHHDRTLCAFSTFCENKVSDVWAMAEQTGDTRVRAQVMAMIEKCPSGALTYEVLPQGAVPGEGETIEPSLPVEIGVTDNGPLWLTGGIPVERADGAPCETRNRTTLCRCGHSRNKPFCDGQHIDHKFQG
ncbi:MAG TPA: ferritin-like domain-containing protein [Armatimonadaceae bacterium]|nr:ferritin-like domain-containing protein [Armatimonadaceae bacterium]